MGVFEYGSIGIVVFLVLSVFVANRPYVFRRRKVRSRYEWLEVLSRSEWKSAIELCIDMQERKGEDVWGSYVAADLDRLELEGLVRVYPLRIKSKGGTPAVRLIYRLTGVGQDFVERRKRSACTEPASS